MRERGPAKAASPKIDIFCPTGNTIFVLPTACRKIIFAILGNLDHVAKHSYREALMNRDAWNSHRWSSQRPRRVEIEPDKPLLQHHCSRCGRDFVESLSGERWAVFVLVFGFRRLPDDLNKQWLGEMCPGERMALDTEVRNKIFDHHAK